MKRAVSFALLAASSIWTLVSAGITDEWFQEGSFETYKKPAVEVYELTTEPGTVETLEGPVSYPAGHYIMTGPKGERYPIAPEKFRELKDDLGGGKCTPKKILKRAKLADDSGSVATSWGEKLHYNPGEDYIVRHGPGDYGVVKKDIFAITYHHPENVPAAKSPSASATSAATTPGMQPGVIAVIVVAAVLVVGGGVAFLYFKQKP